MCVTVRRTVTATHAKRRGGRLSALLHVLYRLDLLDLLDLLGKPVQLGQLDRVVHQDQPELVRGLREQMPDECAQQVRLRVPRGYVRDGDDLGRERSRDSPIGDALLLA